MRLVDNHEGVEIVVEDFDNDIRFILGVIDFLKDVKWIEQDFTSGSYMLLSCGIRFP